MENLNLQQLQKIEVEKVDSQANTQEVLACLIKEVALLVKQSQTKG